MSGATTTRAGAMRTMMTTGDRRRRLSLRRVLAAFAFSAVLMALAAASANADFGLRPDPNDPSRLDFMADVFKADGSTPETQAGASPDSAVTQFGFNRLANNVNPDENVRNIVVDLPPGLVGNPQAVPTCTRLQFNGVGFGDTPCPAQTQVGYAVVTVKGTTPATTVQTTPVYNLAPREGDVAEFGFRVVTTSIHVVAEVVGSGADAHIRARLVNVPQALPVVNTRLVLWGVPADPSHNADRKRRCGGTEAVPFQTCSGGGQVSGIAPRPFWRNPTLCGPPVTTYLTVDSWQHPGVWNPATGGQPYGAVTSSGPTGCDKLQFEPTIVVRPDTLKAGAPTGLTVDINVPQNDEPTGLATPHLKKAVVRLPEGMVVSPSSADGLGACSDAQIDVANTTPVTCPESANLGTVRIDTPVLGRPLTGNIYLGTQTPSQLLRLFLVVEGQGVRLKLPGKVDPDPVTGQLTAVFDNNPQLPFTNLSLHFKGGPRAAVSNPSTCGVKTATTEMTAWSGQTATPSSSFTISGDGNGGACAPQGFTPGFTAGSTNAVGGASSTFNLTFSRDDDDQALRDIAVSMPAGLLAKIASVQALCDEGSAAAGTCSEASRIGSTTTGAGPGTQPFFLPGRVYLGGPYKGAPFNLSIVVPAVAGPFNLGTVVVRAAIFVDRNTTALRIVSDPLPSILMGIPLQIRTVGVSIDRPDFMVNPTSCAAKNISAVVSSVLGTSAGVNSRFQVGSCAALPFKPKMKLRVGVRGRTRAGITTPFEATLTMPAGNANNRSVQVTLPKTLNARLDVVNKRRACTIEQFRADRCPMVVGTGTAVTPLLRDPLTGPAYFVYNPDRRLPDLVVRLKGQVDVDLVGKVTITRDLRLQTTFDTVPDVPISKFALRLVAGRNGPIGVVRSLCLKATRADPSKLEFRGQNGKLVKVNQRLSVAGCGKQSKKPAKRAAKR